MSEQTEVNEPIKQEGDFKMKKKRPKNLAKISSNEITKVDLTKPEATGEIDSSLHKVTIPNETFKTEDNAIQIGETKEMDVEERTGDSQELGKQVSNEAIEEDSPLQEITQEEVKQVVNEAKEAIRDEKVLGKPLPENIEKLVAFMEETGGTVQDYVALNKDYSNHSPKDMLREYYTKAKPHLDQEEIGFLMEDNLRLRKRLQMLKAT